MDKDTNVKKENKKKGFFARFVEKIDKKMEEKAKNTRCSCKTDKDQDKSCCS